MLQTFGGKFKTMPEWQFLSLLTPPSSGDFFFKCFPLPLRKGLSVPALLFPEVTCSDQGLTGRKDQAGRGGKVISVCHLSQQRKQTLLISCLSPKLGRCLRPQRERLEEMRIVTHVMRTCDYFCCLHIYFSNEFTALWHCIWLTVNKYLHSSMLKDEWLYEANPHVFVMNLCDTHHSLFSCLCKGNGHDLGCFCFLCVFKLAL